MKTSLEDRHKAFSLIKQGQSLKLSKKKSCEALGLNYRSVVRWEKNKLQADQRRGPKSVPYALKKEEREEILRVCNSSEFKNLCPWQIVPKLADRGVYLASESSFYKVLKENNQLIHRGATKRPEKREVKGLLATRPNQVWSWDITYLHSPIRGKFYYLYLIMDIYSRMIIGWRIEEEQNSNYSSELIDRCCKKFRVKRKQLTLHSDNGGPMKGATMLATLQKLGITPSFSRPRVSDDNPYSESLFKTLKYHHSMPGQPLSIEGYKCWMRGFEDWYNKVHLHSQISFVTPYSRHYGEDKKTLDKRRKLYLEAKSKNPSRWRRAPRKWEYIEEVGLNYWKKEEKNATISQVA